MADIGFIIYEVGAEPPTPPTPPTPSDSIEGLSDTRFILLREPNWIVTPKGNFDLSREIQQYSGTTLDIYSLTESVSSTLQYRYSNLDKQDEYYFTNFFCQRRGKHKKFWLPYWKNPFILQSSLSNGDNILTIQNCYFNRIDRPYERIFIKLKNELILTRKVLAVVDNGATEDIILETPIDRDIALNEIKFFSRLLMVRFNQDELEIKFSSHDVSNIDFTFKELPLEYPEDES